MTAQHEPNETTRREVEGMAGAGIPQASIAKATGLSEPTLRKHYRHELDNGGTLATGGRGVAIAATLGAATASKLIF